MNVALRSQSLDILSICTGGGGLDLGIELAVPGARSVCMVEREAFAVAHLVAAMEQGLLHPAPVWSDARTFDGRRWRGCVDGLVGGIPCQPHSLAGRKQGQLDARDLWSDARRIVVQSRCWFVLIENVGGMLSAGADEVAGAERVWRDLRKLGFAVEIGLFTAAEVGASHERERVIILGVADTVGERGCSRNCRWKDAADADASGQGNIRCLVDAALVGRGEGRTEPSSRSRWSSIAGANGPMGDACCEPREWHSGGFPRSQATERRARKFDGDCAVRFANAGDGLFPPGPGDLNGWRAVLASAPELEPAFRRVADGLASRLDTARVDRLRMLGNGVVPLQAAHAFRTLCHRLAGRGSRGAAKLMGMMAE